MKKLFIALMATAVILGFAMNAAAINTVDMTLTSPAITKEGCEIVGSLNYGFDAGSTITAGDWWYMDLPVGTEICNTIDYLLVAGYATGGADFVDLTALANDGSGAVFTGVFGIGYDDTGVMLDPDETNGPISVTDISGAPGALTLDGNVTVHVYAAQGSRRVWCYVYGETAGSQVLVGTGTQFNIKILGGNHRNTDLILDNGTDTASADIYGDEDAGDGDVGSDEIDAALNTPYVENTLCVDAEDMSGDLMFVSFDSNEDKFTFTGDAQIAHVASANPIELVYCAKSGADTCGEILIGDQSGCSFDYETPSGYCSTWDGNGFVLQASTTLGDPGDRYDMQLDIETDGVYFASTAAAVYGYEPDEEIDCTTVTGLVASTFTAYLSSGTAATALGDNDCDVSTTNRAVQLKTVGGNITNVDDYDALRVNLPSFVYDTSEIGNGVEAQLTFNLIKYPCGIIFTETVCLGTFVSTCSTTGGAATTLVFPFLPPLDGSATGWWGGLIIFNASATAGSLNLTLYEGDGDTATYTGNLAGYGQFNPGAAADFLAMVTPATGNSGTFGDSNVSVVAVCGFSGVGFAFTGNGEEGTGYIAASNGAFD